MRVRVHPFALTGFFCMAVMMPFPVFCGFAVAVFLHEAGHVLAAALLGKKPESVVFLPVGITLQYRNAESYRAGRAVALAGPAVNLMTFFLCRVLLPESAFSVAIRDFSLSLALINLLPVSIFDGGMALYAAVCPLLGPDRAETVRSVCDVLLLGFLWLSAVYLLFYTARNASLFVLCTYLFAVLILKNEKCA